MIILLADPTKAEVTLGAWPGRFSFAKIPLPRFVFSLRQLHLEPDRRRPFTLDLDVAPGDVQN